MDLIAIIEWTIKTWKQKSYCFNKKYIVLAAWLVVNLGDKQTRYEEEIEKEEKIKKKLLFCIMCFSNFGSLKKAKEDIAMSWQHKNWIHDFMNRLQPGRSLNL